MTPQAPRRSWLGGLRERIWAARRPSIQTLYYANGGLGDELMVTALARTARAAGRPFHVLSDSPALWEGNHDPISVQTGVARWHYARQRGWIGTDIRHLRYETTRAGRHIAQQMADELGLELPIGWRPVLPWLEAARTRNMRQIVVQNSCRGARYAAATKEWPQDRWQRLMNELPEYRLIQVGTRHDPPLDGVEDRRGRTSLREVAELLAQSACFIGLESGLMHVAAATSTPSVIIYGGRTEPSQTGYPYHHPVVTTPACRGCGLNEGCPHGVMCMDIPVDEVLRAVRETLTKDAGISK